MACNGSALLSFSAAEFVYTFLCVSYSCFISLPSRPVRLDTSRNNWRRVRFKRLLIVWFCTCKREPSFERKPPCVPENLFRSAHVSVTSHITFIHVWHFWNLKASAHARGFQEIYESTLIFITVSVFNSVQIVFCLKYEIYSVSGYYIS